MTISRFLFFIYIIFLSYSSNAIELKLPKVALSEVPFELEISEIENNLPIEISFEDQALTAIPDQDGQIKIEIQFNSSGNQEIVIRQPGNNIMNSMIKVLPGWISVAPPLLAIFIALLLSCLLYTSPSPRDS